MSKRTSIQDNASAQPSIVPSDVSSIGEAEEDAGEESIITTETQISLPAYAPEDESYEMIPSLERELETAKAFLQKRSPLLGISLWDHMSEILNKVLSERPNNVIEFFEQYSRRIMEDRLQTKTDHLIKVRGLESQYKFAAKAMGYINRYFERKSKFEDGDEEEEENEIEEGLEEEEEIKEKLTTKWNLIEMNYYLELAGIGFSKMDLFHLNLAINDLAKTQPIINCRFWGKIFGTKKDYFIIEAQFNEEELEKRNEPFDIEEAEAEAELEEEIKEKSEEVSEMFEGEYEESEIKRLQPVYPDMPENPWQAPKETPIERPGQGANKYTYFVANSPVNKWENLPDVAPNQIVIARQIKRAFTGNLDSELFTYPPFPGKECNYLRAQIARISAATIISPKGFYTSSEEMEEVEEENEEVADIFINSTYDRIPLNDLADPNMSSWCHHRQHILKQGRVVWWNPRKVEDEFEGNEAEEEEEEEEKLEAELARELGPPLLSSLQDDATLEAIVPWTTRLPNNILSDIGVVLVRSNLWPGAFTFANKGGSRFENVYIGWGHKYVTYNYSPPPLPYIENEYPIGPEIQEIDDPTLDEEEAWRLAQEKDYFDVEEEGEENESEVEISEDDEDDDE